MEEQGETPKFWVQSAEFRPIRRSSPSSFVFKPWFILIMASLVALVMFFVLTSIISFLAPIFSFLKPTQVKRSWDSLNLLLVFFAILCGVLSRSSTGNVSNDTSSVERTPSPQPIRQSPKWYDRYMENQRSYDLDHPIITRMRSSSSYPDLRQDFWVGNDSGFSYSDDIDLNLRRRSVDSARHRRRRSDGEERVLVADSDPHMMTPENIPADTFAVRREPVIRSRSPPPPASPPAPPPPPVVKRKTRRTIESVPRRGKEEQYDEVGRGIEKNGEKYDREIGNFFEKSCTVGENPSKRFDFGREIEKSRSKRFDLGRQILRNPEKSDRAMDKSTEKEKNRSRRFDLGREMEEDPSKRFNLYSQTPDNPEKSDISVEKKASKSDIGREIPPPPPPPPIHRRSEHKSSSSKGAKDFASALASLYHKKKKHKNKNKTSTSSSNELSAPPFPPGTPPPPPPPPPPPSSLFHNLFSPKKVAKTKRVHSFSPPPPPPPPPKRVPRGKEPISFYEQEDDNLSSGGRSPLVIPMPPPPPRPPFRMHKPKFAVHGDYVRIQSGVSDSSEPDIIEVSDKELKEEEVNKSVSCPSPDVNSKADTFIARLHAGWRLEKLNSLREKTEIGPAPRPRPSPSPLQK